MRRTKVKCPICGEMKYARYAQFRCCKVQHKTANNLFFDGNSPKDTPKDTTQNKQVKESNNKLNLDETTSKDKIKGVTITLVDEDTNEQLLQTEAALFSTPNETLYEGEVETTIKHQKVVESPTKNILVNNPVSLSANTSLTEKVIGVLKNPIVTTGVIAGAGFLVKRYLEKKEKPDPETNW